MSQDRSPAYAHQSNGRFSAVEEQEIARLSRMHGWQVAAHDYMRTRHHGAYRKAVDEYCGQLRFLLPLSGESRVLQLRCGWGAAALNLASCASFVVAMDDRLPQLGFLSARQREANALGLSTLCANPMQRLPFADETFDAVVMLDAIEAARAANGVGWPQAQQTLLGEARRVLRAGGNLLLGVTNRLGFARPRSAMLRHPRTYWGYRRALRSAGFTDLAFHAPLPSHYEPFFILPLDRWRLLNHVVDGLFTAQDYRFKLESRGLGPAYRLAHALWGAGRRLRLTSLARYIMPSYLILTRK